MFHDARIKLTLWYLVILMTVSLFFSSFIYRAATMEFVRFEKMQRFKMEKMMERDETSINPMRVRYPLPPTPELIEEVKGRILLTLGILNGLIFVAGGVLGYFLAGRTLKPIKVMVDEQHRFISDASHELKTPLTSLKTAMEVYLRDPKASPSDAKNLVKESIWEIDKLHALSESLLRLTHFENREPNQDSVKVSLKEVITQAVRTITPLAKKKEISIVQNLVESHVFGSPSELVELCTILLDNAVKYSPEKSTITVQVQIQKHDSIISVKDEGIGIRAEDIPRIFDRFFQSDESRTKNAGNGYGLGLAVAKKIVDRHKGKIHVSSVLGKGTELTISLPLQNK